MQTQSHNRSMNIPPVGRGLTYLNSGGRRARWFGVSGWVVVVDGFWLLGWWC